MKKTFRKSIALLALLGAIGTSEAQISVSSSHVGGVGAFKKGELKRLKGTTTIFVLSSKYDLAEYESILQDTWTVTPYKVMLHDDFSVLDYLTGDYTFASISGFVKQTSKSSYVHGYLDIYMYDQEAVAKFVKKSKPEKKNFNDKFNDALNDAKIPIARVELHPTIEFIAAATRGINSTESRKLLYSGDAFHTYQLGMLKNNLQKINSLIAEEKTMWMYGSDKTPEIKNLKKATLYLPDYLKIKRNAFAFANSQRDDKDVANLMEDYPYKYEFLTEQQMTDKILEGQDMYYLKFTCVNGQKFVHVVNGKTGDLVYREYGTMSYNIKSGDFKDLRKAIDK